MAGGESDNESDNISSPFSGNELRKMLELLNLELARRNITGEICIVVGVAMILGFGNRESTRDIDALVTAPSTIRDAAKKVAEDNGYRKVLRSKANSSEDTVFCGL